MMLVDTSVWIDYFKGKKTRSANLLDASLGTIPIVIGDLILTEVLQGFNSDKEFEIAKDLLMGLPFMSMGGQALALESALNYRILRKKGITVRKTMDVIIGTFCIQYKIPLLHSDKDFDPMVKFLGLMTVVDSQDSKEGPDDLNIALHI